jgi:hypothetical protein
MPYKNIEAKRAAGRKGSKKYYTRHKTQCLEEQKERREKNLEEDPVKVRQKEKEYRADPEVKARKIKYQRNRDRPWRQYLADSCEQCGFIPEHECQLDIHHRDEDKGNNDPANLMTVCANCHRIIEHQGRIELRYALPDTGVVRDVYVGEVLQTAAPHDVAAKLEAALSSSVQ